MELSARQIRAHRLRAHHLDQKYPFGELLTVAGTCGLQNSPPGAWETAAFCRLKNCTLPQLHQALYQKKELLQAWSIRGVPLIFPTADSDVFLSALIAQEGEEPWIYTKGIGLALDHLGMSFAELLPLVESAAEYLEDHTIKSKEELDRVLAQLIAEQLPAQKQSLWNAPSMYGAPDRQTVGGAAVSFLLRPCSFKGLVVFGEREGISPTFTSPLRWLGHKLVPSAQGTVELARRFLHAYGPATPRTFAEWLGSTPAQAKRLWQQIEGAFPQAEEWLLETPDYSTRNHHFYTKKCGFFFVKAIGHPNGWRSSAAASPGPVCCCSARTTLTWISATGQFCWRTPPPSVRFGARWATRALSSRAGKLSASGKPGPSGKSFR